jgi:5-methylcytosine-specific restriction endonuclease McrA
MSVLKPYTKTYLNHFGYCIDDIIPCEICGNKAVDIHHIEARSKRKDLENNISNLMALCREHHIEFGDKVKYKNYLNEIHQNKLKAFER